jgi:hypothetical protein
MPVTLARAPAVDLASALLDFLEVRLGVDGLEYRERPEPIVHGWETHVYRFQLQTKEELSGPLTGPLVIPGYCSDQALDRIQREYDIQTYLAGCGYPVARPVLIEKDGDLFGEPFLVMEWAPGQTLLDILYRHIFSIWWAPGRMAELHAHLHAFVPPEWTRPGGSLLDRSLACLRAALQEYELDSLAPGLDWLEERQPPAPEEETLLHLDFHPVNLIFDHKCCQAVLDWSEWDMGDRHADIATTLLLIKSAPLSFPWLWHRATTAVGKHLLAHWYFKEYRRHFPVDDGKLPYNLAWAHSAG